jgi:hypothetical protein
MNFAVTARMKMGKPPATDNVEAKDIHEAAKKARKKFPKAIELRIEGGKKNPVSDGGPEPTKAEVKAAVEKISADAVEADARLTEIEDAEPPSLEQMHAGVTAVKPVRRGRG